MLLLKATKVDVCPLDCKLVDGGGTVNTDFGPRKQTPDCKIVLERPPPKKWKSEKIQERLDNRALFKPLSC